MREVIARFADDFDFLDFKPDYGPATVCGHAAVQGFAVGIVTNNGPLDPAGATKATHFIQACCQAGLPILYLQNTTGYIVGRASEEAGMIKHGSKMIQAVSNANVPQITLMCGASFGAGNYGMCGRAYNPRFLFSWPNAQTAVMGAEQAALTMANVMEAGAQAQRRDAGRRADRRAEEEDRRQFREPEQRVHDHRRACSTTASSIRATPATCSALRSRSAARRMRAPCGRFSSAWRGHEVAADRQSRRDRAPHHPHREAHGRCARSRSIPMRIATRCMCARRTRRCGSAARPRASPI